MSLSLQCVLSSARWLVFGLLLTASTVIAEDRQPKIATPTPASMAEREEILNRRVSVDFVGAALPDVVATLGKLGQVEIQLDAKGLADAGIPADAPTTLA